MANSTSQPTILVKKADGSTAHYVAEIMLRYLSAEALAKADEASGGGSYHLRKMKVYFTKY